MTEYDVILADPPWEYDGGGSRGAEQHYPTMTFDDIAALPIAGLAAPNAALFLWGVWPHLPRVLDLMPLWGFAYTTIAWVWVKMRASGMGLHMGMGRYTRSNSEPCLLGIRGRMPVQAFDVLSVMMSPVREHSRKPDEQYEKIERLYPGRRYLELFARRRHEGWFAWGNEVRSDVEIR